MADESSVAAPPPASRRLDPWVLIGAVFFIGAVAAVVYPALRAGPAGQGGLMLLAGLAGVAVLGLFAFRQNGSAESAGDLDALLNALAEPAAVISPDGRILAANAAWRHAAAPLLRLPRPRGALEPVLRPEGGLERPGSATADIDFDGRAQRAAASRLDGRRSLLRLYEPAQALIAAPRRASSSPPSLRRWSWTP